MRTTIHCGQVRMREVYALVSLLVLGGAAMTPGDVHAGELAPIHVFLVRHAEVQRGSGSDPGLSPIGEGRAYDLARLLSSTGVTHLYASEYQRTQQTLAPLAEERRLEVQVVPARDPETQIEALRSLEPGAVAVVSGHSNTVPSLVQMLGGRMSDVEDTQHGLMFDESEFDRLVLVVLQPQADGSVEYLSTLEMRYGDGAAPDAAKRD